AVAGQRPGVVLEPEARAATETEAARLAAELPHDLPARAIDLVDRGGVARGDQHAPARQRLDRVDVEGVVGRAVGRRGVRLGERYVPERVPLPDHEAGADVHLLDDRVEQRRELAGGGAGQ